MKRQRVDPIKSRIAIIRANILWPEKVLLQSIDIRKILGKAATDIVNIVEREGEGTYDVGRLIRALDLLGRVKRVAVDSITIPLYKEGDEKGSGVVLATALGLSEETETEK